jgi:hypothetical protein
VEEKIQEGMNFREGQIERAVFEGVTTSSFFPPLLHGWACVLY